MVRYKIVKHWVVSATIFITFGVSANAFATENNTSNLKVTSEKLSTVNVKQAPMQRGFKGLKKNIPIGTIDGVELTIDLALPEQRSRQALPVFVMIHGGGFVKGDKSKAAKRLKRFAEKGIAAASLMYRFAPEHKFPAQIEDTKAAIRFLKAHAETFNLNPEKIVVSGSSAGGYLAIMLGVTGNEDVFSDLALYPEQNSNVKAVIAGSTAAVDFSLPQYRDFKIIHRLLDKDDVNNDDALKRVSPTTYLDKNDPEFFLFHGDADKLVSVEMMRSFTKRLDALNHPYSYLEVIGGGHSINQTRPKQAKQVLRASMAFFQQQVSEE